MGATFIQLLLINPEQLKIDSRGFFNLGLYFNIAKWQQETQYICMLYILQASVGPRRAEPCFISFIDKEPILEACQRVV